MTPAALRGVLETVVILRFATLLVFFFFRNSIFCPPSVCCRTMQIIPSAARSSSTVYRMQKVPRAQTPSRDHRAS